LVQMRGKNRSYFEDGQKPQFCLAENFMK